MQDVYQVVVSILAKKCKVNPEFITPATDLFTDLGIDSAEFIDASFSIEDAFGITLPVDEWMNEVNAGDASAARRFRIDNFVAAITELISQARA